MAAWPAHQPAEQSHGGQHFRHEVEPDPEPPRARHRIHRRVPPKEARHGPEELDALRDGVRLMYTHLAHLPFSAVQSVPIGSPSEPVMTVF